MCFFFVKQMTAYEMRISDWSSDVCSSSLHELRQAMAVVNVVSEDQASRVAPQELLTNDECLCEPVRTGLYCIAETHAPTRAVPKKMLECRDIARRGNDKNLTNTGQHQRTDRVIDHWLVVHRHQLLADRVKT